MKVPITGPMTDTIWPLLNRIIRSPVRRSGDWSLAALTAFCHARITCKISNVVENNERPNANAVCGAGVKTGTLDVSMDVDYSNHAVA